MNHQARHYLLHQHLDELVADYLRHHRDALPSKVSVAELLEWSFQQTLNPTSEDNPVPVFEGRPLAVGDELDQVDPTGATRWRVTFVGVHDDGPCRGRPGFTARTVAGVMSNCDTYFVAEVLSNARFRRAST